MTLAETAAFWDSIASRYTNLWEADTLEGRQDLDRLRQIFETYQIGNSGDHILDLACGKAAILPLLIERRPAKITSVDLSLGMLHRAIEKTASLGLGQQNDCVCADGSRLPFMGDAFDEVMIFNALPHFDNKALLFGECWRVLKPNGYLTIMHSLNRAALDAMHGHHGFDMEKSALPSSAAFDTLLHDAHFTRTAYVDTPDTDYFLLRAQK